MNKDGALTIKELRELLTLDAETGRLYWNPRDEGWFPGTGSGGRKGEAARWNACWAGKEAITGPNNGYRRGIIKRRAYYAHCLVWALVHGYWAGEIDHDNRDRSDNRPGNLIERSHAQNMKNQPVRVNSTSGVLGVNFNKRQQKWVARIFADDRRICLGTFATFDEAVAARREAEARHGYHPNHGT